ncbi:MAG: ABC transporter ATP-binding protein [Butyricicoccus sp.]|nr:ABC transporter ATP-binding protein [Butyricicoccus sp.]MBQ8585299.1 ABC transporter ATP-binding protein [Butyricicoccus sp.]
MLKTLLRSVREFKRDSLLAPAFVACEGVAEVIIPLLMARLIDYGIDRGDMGAIWKYGLLLLAVAVFSMICGSLAAIYAARASSGFAHNLRRDMYHRVQDFSFANIDKFSTASLVTRMTTDVTRVQNAYQMVIRMAVRSPVLLIFGIVMAFYVNHRLAPVFLVVTPFMILGLYLITTRAFPLFTRVFKTYDDLNAVVQENVRGVRVVKSYVREDYENAKFNKVSDLVYKLFLKAERLVSLNGPLMQLCMYACMLLFSWFGARMIVSGSMTTGELTSMLSYVMQILMNLMMVSMIFVMLIMSKASGERIAEVLNEESTLKNPTEACCKVEDGSIEFENVDFSYSDDPDRLSLHGVNLSIRSGETIGILGGTGSAKSTLISLIPRLYDATHGTVRVGGRDVREYDLTALRDAVSVVLQKNVLFSGTIKENLRWGDADATDEELVRVCQLAQADDFIRAFPDGYDTYIEQGGTNVSGGQKQRLCIARALLKKPKILILDDSTSAVDTATDAKIRRAFRDEIPNTTKLIVAQRISSIQDADRILVLDDGGVAAIGTHDELLASSPIYQEIYEFQTRGGDGDADHE